MRTAVSFNRRVRKAKAADDLAAVWAVAWPSLPVLPTSRALPEHRQVSLTRCVPALI
jgi:hypothetical protein